MNTAGGGDGRMLDERERLALIGEMAAEMAHELRNVLLTISSSAHMGRVAVTASDASGAEAHLVTIEKSVNVAQEIVDDVMSLAMGEPIATTRIPLSEIVLAARTELGSTAAHWNDGGLPPEMLVQGHPRLLVRLLHAIYDNAIRVSAPRVPTVATRAWNRADRVVIEIADDGPGVPDAIAGRLFEPFVTARDGGSGLGLALVRRIATAHGGSVALASSSLRGATFHVELPAIA